MSRLSIRTRLTVWVAAVLGCVLATVAGTLWWSLRDSVSETIDAGLVARTDAIGRFLDQPGGQPALEELQDDLREFVALDPGLNLIRITNLSNGRELYRSAGFDPAQAPAAGLGFPVHAPASGHSVEVPAHAFRDVTMNGHALRLVTARVPARGHAYVIDVAMPVGELREVFQEFGLTVLVLLPVGILLAAAGGYWISRRALAPVDRMAGTARAITAHNPGWRLDVPDTGDELQRLAETLNAMLDRLEAAFRETTRFTADASHELRTPIALIRTSAELALRRERTPDEYREALTDILRESERTSGLVENLLSLARADSAADDLRKTAVDVRALLAEMRPSLAHLCAAKELALDLADEGPPIEVLGDILALRRLVLILADNAVKYTNAPGRVGVSLAQEGNRVVLVVQDTGIGIAPEDLPHVFDRFYRADKARSRDSGGAGLGLSIARSIVERHGGDISIVSEPGAGCRVTVSLERWAGVSPVQSRSSAR